LRRPHEQPDRPLVAPRDEPPVTVQLPLLAFETGSLREGAMREEGTATSKAKLRREDILAAHARLLDDVLSGIADHVYMSDLEGRFIYVSPSAARLLGLDVPEMLGRTWREVGVEDRAPNVHVIAEEAATLAWLGNQAAFEIHAWTTRLDDPLHPTFALIDIDPG
jgi:PAS domain-containing protein